MASLRTRASAAILAPMVVSLGVFGAFATSRVRGGVLQRTVEELDAIADLKAGQIRTLVAAYQDSARSAARRIDTRALASMSDGRPAEVADLAALDHSLERIAASEAYLADIAAISSQGVLVASTRPHAVGRLAEVRPDDLPAAVDGVDAVSIRPLAGPFAGATQIIAVAPVTVGPRRVGAVEVRFRPTLLNRAIESAVFGETGEVLVAARDADGTARFLTDVRRRADATGDVLATPVERGIPMVRALEGEEVTMVEHAADYEATPVVAVTRYLADLDWGLVAKMDESEVFGPVHGIRDALLALSLALILFALGVGTVVGGRLTRAAQRLESELRSRERAEGRFRRVVDSAPSAMLIVAADGRIRYANAQLMRLLGYTAAALTSMTVEELIAPELRGAHRRHRAAFDEAPARRAMGARSELFARHRTGKRIPVEVGLTPIETDDGPMVVAALVDLSQQKASERALAERADALARSNRELDEFAYVASHDLKAPLRGIDQLAGFIEDDAGHLLPEESRADLARLRSRASRLEHLLNALLAYSRVGRKDGEAEWVDLPSVVHQVADLYAPDGFRVEVEDELPRLFAPPAAVDLVLRNLVMNAVKHHDGPSGVIRITGREEGGAVHLAVADDGPGIPFDCREKVFELFQTLRPRDEVEGSGMGLALVRKTLQAHGGSIALAVGDGRGATFLIRWPLPASARRDAA